jgi:glycosyltransferase involved in cell wall biosynthesis
MNDGPARPRRLLIVTYHFPPSAAVAVFRMLGFARHLPRYGWQVGVVAPPRLPDEPVDEALLQRVPAQTTIFAAPYPNSLPAKLARQCVYHGVWLPRALPAVIRAVRQFRPHVVLTSGPPHCVHFLGLFLQRFYGLPWVLSLRDPWFTNNRPAQGWFPWASWERFWERRLFQKADCIIANTPLGRDGLLKAYPGLASKVTYVTNGFDPEFFPPPGPLAPRNDRLTILYAGELYNGRDPRPVFDALVALEKARAPGRPPIRLRMLGQSTDHRLDLLSAIRERGLEGIVELGGHVPYAEALQAMTEADVQLLLDAPGRKISIPAKLFEYVGAARPVLALAEPDGDIAWALKTSGIPYRIAPPGSAIKIQQALQELRDGLCEHRFALPSAKQQATFTRAHTAQELAKTLDGMLRKNSPVSGDPTDAFLSSAPNHDFELLGAAPASGRPHYAGS